MADKAEKDLEKALDESLADLAKAAQGEEAEEAKGEKSEEAEEAKGDKKPPFMKKDGDEDEDDEKKKESEDAKGDESEEAKGEKEEDESEKSMREGRKAAATETIAKSETVANAIEVSKFLREVVKSLGDMHGELVHEVRTLRKENAEFKVALAKSQQAQADIIKSFGADVSAAAKTALPRKGVDAAAVKTLEKGFRNDGGKDEKTLSKSQVAEKLASLEIEHKVPLGTTSKFETTGELHKSLEPLVYESK